jgi:O-antigen/teichoic acid export membrane protein
LTSGHKAKIILYIIQSTKDLFYILFRTALLILSGNATASLLLLARNLIVARLISIENYGIAATFAVVMAMVEMASTLGLQQQIVQARDGDDPRFQAALQGFQVFRGFAAGLALFFMATPVAIFLEVPEVVWAYQLLSLVPVIRSFEHFDVHRLNRKMRFAPMLLTGGIPAFLSLLLVWPLLAWLEDWRVMLYGILAHVSLTVITSHLVAERPYYLVFDRNVIGRSLKFGWPILLNAVLLFFVFQGDKMIVGRLLGMENLAIFAIGVTLTLTPTLVIAKSAQNFFLPQLSTAASTPGFTEVAGLTLQTINTAALIFLVTILLFGGPFLHSLLGDKYDSLVPLLVWFGIGQALRLCKVGPAIVALSIGHTSNAMLANALRVLILPLTWLVIQQTETLIHVLWMAIIAEAIGLMLALTLLAQRTSVTALSIFRLQIPCIFAFIVIAVWAYTHPPNATWPSFKEFIVGTFIIITFVGSMPSIRKLLRSTI